MRYLGDEAAMMRAYFPTYQEEEDISPRPAPRPIGTNLVPWLINRPAPAPKPTQDSYALARQRLSEEALAAERWAAAEPVKYPITPAEGGTGFETYGREAEERLATEQRLSAELGNKTASQQGSILSQPSVGRSTGISIGSLDFAQRIAGALIGGWASVEQQKELAKNLYKNQKAYVPSSTAQQVSTFRWEYIGYAVLGFAVIGGLIYFVNKKKGGSSPAASPGLALPVVAKNRGRRRR